MIYLLDTDTLIFLVRGLKSGKRPVQRQKAQMILAKCQQSQAAGDSVGLSAITVSELEYGARHGNRYDQEIMAVRKLITPFELFAYDSLACPTRYGQIRDDLERRGVLIGSMDLMIAAHASALGATLVTNNVAHFARVAGLRVVNWSVA